MTEAMTGSVTGSVTVRDAQRVTRVVVKAGGEVLAGEHLQALCAGVLELAVAGVGCVVVHGGGAQATDLSRRLGIEPQMVGGRRITDAATLTVMKYVVAGQLNVDAVAALEAAGVRAVGLHGASGGVIRAVKRPPRKVSGGGEGLVDFGHVGDVTGFNTALLDLLGTHGYVPVLACLGAGLDGAVYNINADVVASALAAALGADALLAVTPVGAVLRDVRDPLSRLARLTATEARAAIAEGVIVGGMIPKVEEALGALAAGVAAVHIVAPGDLARAVTRPGSAGTTLVTG